MTNHSFIAIDHVQLAMPQGEEEAARRFYCDLLGMVEIPKPAELAKRGGCWFASGSVQLHLGVEVDFRPAKKAHPALRCGDYDGLTSRLALRELRSSLMRAFPGFGDATCRIRLETGSS